MSVTFSTFSQGYTLEDSHELAIALNKIETLYKANYEQSQRRWDAVAKRNETFALIGEALKEAANDNDLCSVYDNWLTELQGDSRFTWAEGISSFFDAATRVKEFTVLVSFGSVAVTVMAANSDEACEKVENDGDWDSPEATDFEAYVD